MANCCLRRVLTMLESDVDSLVIKHCRKIKANQPNVFPVNYQSRKFQQIISLRRVPLVFPNSIGRRPRMRSVEPRAKVSLRAVLLRETRESTCKSNLIDRISTAGRHTFYYYHFLRTCARKRRRVAVQKKNRLAPPSTSRTCAFDHGRLSRKASFTTPIINAFHYYRRTSGTFFAHVRLLLRRARRRSFSASPSRRLALTT